MAEPHRHRTPMKQGICSLLLAVAALACCGMALADQEKPYEFEEKPWVEAQTAIPAYPKPENLIEFQVGPTEHNRFFIDGSTIDVGVDGVVRYVLVVKTPGGATNVSLEAMRCGTRGLKLFAVGRFDQTWDKIQSPQWRLVENKSVNHHHAILSRDFLCPAGHAPRDAADARAGLRRGKHPDAA